MKRARPPETGEEEEEHPPAKRRRRRAPRQLPPGGFFESPGAWSTLELWAGGPRAYRGSARVDDDEEEGEGELVSYRSRVSLGEQASVLRRLRGYEKQLAATKLPPYTPVQLSKLLTASSDARIWAQRMCEAQRAVIGGGAMDEDMREELAGVCALWRSCYTQHCYSGLNFARELPEGRVFAVGITVAILRMHWLVHREGLGMRPSDLAHLPEHIVLPEHRDVPVGALTVGRVLGGISFLLQNVHVDYAMMRSRDVARDVRLYADLLLARLADFATCKQPVAARPDMPPVFFSPINGAPSRRYLLQTSHLLQMLTMRVHEWWASPPFSLRYEPGVAAQMRSDRDAAAGFFTAYLRGSVARARSILRTFAGDARVDAAGLLLPPATHDYDRVANHTQDFWTRYAFGQDTREELLSRYYPEAYKMLRANFDGLTNALKNEDADPGELFDAHIAPLMGGQFNTREALAQSLLGDACDVLPRDMREALAANPHLQYQYQWPAAALQNLYYLRALHLWLSSELHIPVGLDHFVVFHHQLYMHPAPTLRAAMQRSAHVPVLVQMSPMRFDVLHKGRLTYGHNDIRCALGVWLRKVEDVHAGRFAVDAVRGWVIPARAQILGVLGKPQRGSADVSAFYDEEGLGMAPVTGAGHFNPVRLHGRTRGDLEHSEEGYETIEGGAGSEVGEAQYRLTLDDVTEMRRTVWK